MKVSSTTTEAEKVLQVELDSARVQYEKDMNRLRSMYLSNLEVLHNEFARAQSSALDKYHSSARGELTKIMDDLAEIIDSSPGTADIRVNGSVVSMPGWSSPKTETLPAPSFFVPIEFDPDFAGSRRQCAA